MRKYLGRTLGVMLAIALMAMSAGHAWAATCTGVPAFASCTAYANGAQVTYNNTLYHSIAAIPNNRDCPPNSPYNPSNDNWWVNDGTCSGATATRTATATATARATATPTTGGATATRTNTATATRTPTATATSSGPGCYAAWNSGSIYTTNMTASRVCGGINENFHAMFWTQGNDPCTNRSNGTNGEEWMSEGACGGGGTATPTSATPTPTSGGAGIGAIVSSAQFDLIWPPSQPRSATYTYADFVTAGNSYFPGLCSGSMAKRECAAYFASKDQETGKGQYDRELYCQPGGGGYGTTACNYCDTGNAPCGACASGQQYWGRHAVQLSWNYNYCNAGNQLVPTVNLHADPNAIFNNKVTGWRVSDWYWMTQLGPAVSNGYGTWPMESAHAAIVSTAAGLHGFGGTIRAVNGGIECQSRIQQQINRVTYFVGGGYNESAPGAGSTAAILGYAGTTADGISGQHLWCSP